MLDNAILTKYIDRIYKYAVNKTYSRDEADELSSEIILQALNSLNNLHDDSKFEPWLWSLADNTAKVFKRKRGRERAIYSFDNFNPEQGDEDEYLFEEEEIFEDLRIKISQLSGMYRDIIILHYYDNLTCSEISRKLGIPEGTVMWRLSEGRNRIKKETTEMNDKALKPVKLNISINGNGNYNGKDRPFPWTYINDALSQNILWHSYESAKSIEELSKLCGVPAYYIENSVENLIKREAMIKTDKIKYRTDFIIYGDQVIQYAMSAHDKFTSAIAEPFIQTLKGFTKAVIETGIYTAGKSEEELIYLFGILALEHLNLKHNPIPAVPYKVRYDGNEWAYHAHGPVTLHKPGMGLGAQKSLNQGSEGSIAHYSYNFNSFKYREMMTDDKINICEYILYGRSLAESLKEKASILIKSGYLKSADNTLSVQIPYIDFHKKLIFDLLADDHFTKIMDVYKESVEKFASGYRKLFPVHLHDDVNRACNYLFIMLFVVIAEYGQAKGLLTPPPAGNVCDVLIQWKEQTLL